MFGECRFLDTSRIICLFPALQILPGRKRRSRRDDHGFVRYNPQLIGKFNHLTPSNFFGEVPIGRFVREIMVDILNYLDVDIYNCSPDDVSYIFCIMIIKFS